MPNPAKYTDERKFMKDCIHQTMHVEKKKRDQGAAQCLNMWRSKGKKALTEELDIIASELEQQDPRIALAIDKVSDNIERALAKPAANPLQDCLEELKFGRPSKDQKFLDKVIKDL